MGYRTSIVAKKNYIVLEAVIRLEPGDAGDIRSYMEELKRKKSVKAAVGIPQRGGARSNGRRGILQAG